MKSLTQSLKHVGLLTVALTLALAANFAYGQWADPGYGVPTAPGSPNVDAPINVSNSEQTKDGDLNVGNRLTVSGNWPTFHLIDLNMENSYRHLVTDPGQLRIQHAKNFGPFSTTDALLLNPPTNGGTGYALFENQVRANEYCDRDGNNCMSGGGASYASCAAEIRTNSCNTIGGNLSAGDHFDVRLFKGQGNVAPSVSFMCIDGSWVKIAESSCFSDEPNLGGPGDHGM